MSGPAARVPDALDGGPDRATIDAYLRHLAHERRLSPNTNANYRRDLEALRGWCAGQRLADWATLDPQHVRVFAAASHHGGLSPRSVQRRLSALRGFFRWLMREGLATHDPTADVRAPKAAKRLPKTLDVDRMQRLLDVRAAVPDDRDPVLHVRDRAIMELFYSSGLRLAELVGLDLDGLDLRDRTVRVLGKGANTRIVPVGTHACTALSDWLSARGALAAVGQRAVFVGRNGRRLGARAVQLRVAAWAKRQGLDVRMHPHLFRHSVATHLLESSQDLRGVQELLGHASISTTQAYTHLDFQHLARIYDAAHPRARRSRARRDHES